MLNQNVLYNNKKYILLYEYTSGFCEIKEVDSADYYKIELVHKSELKFHPTNSFNL